MKHGSQLEQQVRASQHLEVLELPSTQRNPTTRWHFYGSDLEDIIGAIDHGTNSHPSLEKSMTFTRLRKIISSWRSGYA